MSGPAPAPAQTPAAPAAAALTVGDLTFGYEPGTPVIEGLTGQVQPGRISVLIGPNAAGKSTLLRLMLGQLRPWSGWVRMDGRDVESLSASRRAAFLSYVPQRAGVSFAFNVGQVVRMGRFALPPDEPAVQAALAACDLQALAGRPYAQLSVGQQQRVLLARALAQSAGSGRYMLLDEPGSAMDLWHTHQTMDALRGLARQGLGVFVVLHDLNLAARYADQVWLLDRGRLLAAGDWQTVMNPAVLEPVYRVRLTAVAAPGTDRPMFAVNSVGSQDG